MIIVNCQQNGLDGIWDACRLGKPTASKFGEIYTATGKVSASREKRMIQLACEAVSGRKEESFQSYRMKQASLMEDESRNVYAMNHEDIDVYKVGFVFKDEKRMIGASPDALCDPNGGFETKDAEFTVQYERLKKGAMVTSHIPQVQGGLYVCEREWWDFQSYCSGLPVLCIRNYRDEKYITRLAEELEKFCYELAVKIKELREMQSQ